MAKSARGRRRVASRQFRASPYPLPRKQNSSECTALKKGSKHSRKKDWEDATCSVCMEYPHNAVLLLCSSHDKGCRPYMCGTSFRYSNCLDQYKKAYTKVTQTQSSNTSNNTAELACPLCRGKVKGWTVVEPAREFLNSKKRSCTQDKCTFMESFRELRKHVKSEHPCARPREVDPDREQRWRSLERERERDDVMSTLRSSMPGAMVFGDYVIERGQGQAFESDEDGFDVDIGDMNSRFELGIDSNLMFLFMHAFGQGGNGQNRRLRRNERELDQSFNFSDHEIGDGGENNGVSLAQRLRRQGRLVLGRSDRRQRRREAMNNGD